MFERVGEIADQRARHDYADYGGWLSMPPAPYDSTGATVYVTGFKADLRACQAFIDRSFNRAVGHRQFRVLIDCVFLIAMDNPDMRVVAQPYRDQYTIAESDIGLWLLVGNEDAHGKLAGIGWIPAYLFVNNVLPNASGREIWGFPKVFSTVDIPAHRLAGGPFAVSTNAVSTFGPTAKAVTQAVMTFWGEHLHFEGVTGDGMDIFRRICEQADPAHLSALTDLAQAHPFLGAIGGIPLRMFNLKRFRAADSATAAAYSAVLQGPLILTRLHGAGLLTGHWTFQFAALDSYPFIRDLGLGDPADGTLSLTSRLMVWTEIDYTLADAWPID